jgi:hypothetical protein
MCPWRRLTKLAGMNIFKSIIAGVLLSGSTVVAVVGLVSGPAAAGPLPAWAPNAHNTFAMTR